VGVPGGTGSNGGSGDRARFPGAGERWRCGGCGNLTRFDVVHASRSREFWHVDLSGEGTLEETAVLAETVESVTCRWCGRADAIEYVPRAGSGEA
jgi:hypothetical protein